MNRITNILKTIKDKLLRTGFFHVFGSNVINQMLGLISGVLLVRILSKPQYGIYSYAYSIVNFFLLFNGLGATSGLLQVVSESDDTKLNQKFYGFATAFGILFDLFLAAVLIATAFFFPLRIDGAREQLLLMIFLPLVQLLYQLKTTRLRAEVRFKEYARTNTLNSFFLLVFALSGAFFFREKGVIFGQYLAFLLSTIVLRFSLGQKFSFSFRGLEKEKKKDILKISGLAAVTTGISQILYTLDVFIVGMVIANESAVAMYKTATTIPTALSFIPSAITVYLYPYFAKKRNDPKWLASNYRKLLLLLGVLNACICTVLFSGAPLVIRLIFGSQYLDAVPAFRILVIGYFFSGTFRNVTANLLVTQRQMKYNLVVSAVSGVANIIGNIILVSRFGAIGAAYTTLFIMIATGAANTAKMISVIRKKGKNDTEES